MIKLNLDTESRRFINVTFDTVVERKIIDMALAKRAEGYMFQPRFKKKKWDGYDRFLKSYDRVVDEETGRVISEKFRFGVGLWREVLAAAENNNLQVSTGNIEELIDESIDPVKLNSFTELLLDGVVDFKGEQVAPRDYQFEAAYRMLKNKYCTQELATSAGKTVIFFIYLSYLKFKKQIHSNGKKALLVVPKVGLLNQTYEAFTEEYSNGLVPLKIMRLGDKFKFKEKDFRECDLLISTYQSLGNIEDSKVFEQFNVICIDEAHSAKSATISRILTDCKNSRYRSGLSGTIRIKNEFADSFYIQEHIGPLRMIVSSEFLQKEGHSPNIQVKILGLKHRMTDRIHEMDQLRWNYKENGLPEGFRDAKEFGRAMFEMEKQYLYESARRLEIICNLVKKLKGNTLILFNNVKDGYGKAICDALSEFRERVYYIDGSVDVDVREEFQRAMESNDGVIIVASYGTFSTGLNIKRLHSIILAESSKSEITIRQSIGRGMRKYIDKNLVTIYDLQDIFVGTLVTNYMAVHGSVRAKIYDEHRYVHSYHEVLL